MAIQLLPLNQRLKALVVFHVESSRVGKVLETKTDLVRQLLRMRVQQCESVQRTQFESLFITQKELLPFNLITFERNLRHHLLEWSDL